MSMMPDASNAPPFSAGAQPDARQMSLSDNLNGALQHLTGDPLTPEEMQLVKAFFIAAQQVFAQKAAQAQGGMQNGAQSPPGGAGGPAGAGASQPPSNATEDYGTGYGGAQGEPTTQDAPAA